MDLAGARVALYGRFLSRHRSEVGRVIAQNGGQDERDLTRRTTLLVVGRGARNLIPSGSLQRKLGDAKRNNIPVLGESRFWFEQAGGIEQSPTYPLSQISSEFPDGLVDILNAFDLILLSNSNCRFGDVATLRTANELLDSGHELSSVVRVMLRARDVAPGGRHRTVASGTDVRLQWDDAETELDGQGLLQLQDGPSLDDVFEEAIIAEAEGDLTKAARGFELCAQMDKKDAVAPFNLGNVLEILGQSKDALRSYDQALARDSKFSEAYYNRSKIFEAAGEDQLSENDLRAALDSDPNYLDAMFNLAQHRLRLGDPKEALSLFNKFIEQCDDDEWIGIARRASNAATRLMKSN